MKIKWRVSLVMILLCLGMILLESTITMVQLKGNMEREHDQVIQKTSLQTALSFSYISDDIELFIFNMCRSEGVAATLLYTDTAYSKMVQINGFLRSFSAKKCMQAAIPPSAKAVRLSRSRLCRDWQNGPRQASRQNFP